MPAVIPPNEKPTRRTVCRGKSAWQHIGQHGSMPSASTTPGRHVPCTKPGKSTAIRHAPPPAAGRCCAPNASSCHCLRGSTSGGQAIGLRRHPAVQYRCFPLRWAGRCAALSLASRHFGALHPPAAISASPAASAGTATPPFLRRHSPACSLFHAAWRSITTAPRHPPPAHNLAPPRPQTTARATGDR